MTNEELATKGKDAPEWLMDYQEMWVDLFELMMAEDNHHVMEIMSEMEQENRASVILREELWKKSQKKP